MLIAIAFHALGRTEGIAAIIVADADYPQLVAHQLLGKIVDEFVSKYPRTAYSDPNIKPNSCPLPQLKDYIVKYQDPSQADSIMKIQRELDETKIVVRSSRVLCDGGELAKEEQLHKTIESVLERGEKIDSVSSSSFAESAVLTGYSWLQKAMVCRHKARCSTRRYVSSATFFRESS